MALPRVGVPFRCRRELRQALTARRHQFDGTCRDAYVSNVALDRDSHHSVGAAPLIAADRIHGRCLCGVIPAQYYGYDFGSGELRAGSLQALREFPNSDLHHQAYAGNNRSGVKRCLSSRPRSLAPTALDGRYIPCAPESCPTLGGVVQVLQRARARISNAMARDEVSAL